MTKIGNKLLWLGITPNLLGFGYIEKSIEIILKEPDIKILALYEEVAKETSSNGKCVDRSIRHAITKIDLEKWRSIGGLGKKNSEFLKTLATILEDGRDDDDV